MSEEMMKNIDEMISSLGNTIGKMDKVMSKQMETYSPDQKIIFNKYSAKMMKEAAEGKTTNVLEYLTELKKKLEDADPDNKL